MEANTECSFCSVKLCEFLVFNFFGVSSSVSPSVETPSMTSSENFFGHPRHQVLLYSVVCEGFEAKGFGSGHANIFFFNSAKY